MKKIQTILIIDDDDIDHTIAKYAINDFNSSIDIFSAYDGQEALDFLAESDQEIDLIFLDINMPGINGHEFLEEYSKDNAPTSVVVMLTSSDQTKDKDKCKAYNFVKDYLCKPLEPEMLMSLEKLL